MSKALAKTSFLQASKLNFVLAQTSFVQEQGYALEEGSDCKQDVGEGRCHVIHQYFAHDFHCYHIKPRSSGGSDKYSNLVIVHSLIHRLVYAIEQRTINQF